MPRSIVWKYFEKIDDKATKCNVCGAEIITCKNTTNLFQHLKHKHEKEHRELLQERSETPLKRKQLDQPTLMQFKKAMTHYDETSQKKQAIDRSLILMIVKDLQPVRIVEDEGFKHFVETLDPRYSLPSRRKIMRDMLPALHGEKMEELKTKLDETTSVAITSDIWTSNQTQSYLSVTAHFLDSDPDLCSAVLRVVHLTSNHTSDNIADELQAVFTEYSIADKISVIVSDNASNMTAAVKKLSIRHLPCFAHTLNLIVRAAIEETPDMLQLQAKVKRIVDHFHRSVNASDRLRQVQRQQNVSELKLINDVETRWNSTLLMFQRFIDIHDSVTTSLIQLGKGALCLSDEELGRLKEAVLALAPFLKATEEMSAEKVTTLSKVIPLARSLLTKARASSSPLGSALETNMIKRKFHLFETFHPLNKATLLDPRFKKIAFKDPASLEQTKISILDETSHANSTVVGESEPSTSTSANIPDDDLWTDFDADVSASTVHRSPQVDSHLEMRRYMEDQNILRTENPFTYWQENEHSLKKLANVAKKYLCIPATSVPSERLFSKAGELISARRNRLKPKNVNTFLFLNKACSVPNR